MFGTYCKNRADAFGHDKAIAIQPDHKIILTGYSYTTAGVAEIVVARYDNFILGANDSQNIEFRLYPNPANDRINIEMSDAVIFNDASEVIRKALQATHQRNPDKQNVSATAFEIALQQLV